MKVIGWKIWYGDKTVVSSRESKWEDCPNDNVQYVILYYDKKDGQNRPLRQILTGDDFYFYTYPDIYGSNKDKLYLNKARYPNAHFKRGKWISAENLEDIRKKSMEDYDI